MPYRIVNIGDSVQWGQGLEENQKYDVQVRDRVRAQHPDAEVERLAHSGAVLWRGPSTARLPGELPVDAPTIAVQITQVAAPEEVDLVLMNGGINDVGASIIINPFSGDLESKIHLACYDEMFQLLRRATATFTKPTCRMVVVGYYPIVSEQSDFKRVPELLAHHNIAVPVDPLGVFERLIIQRSRTFFERSEALLAKAVQDHGDPRIQFVSSGFTAANSVFVDGTSLLFGLIPGGAPADPVAAVRKAQCETQYPGELDFFAREKCIHASIAHPNPDGARQYAEQIMRTLGI